jgi:hypothetical protein
MMIKRNFENLVRRTARAAAVATAAITLLLYLPAQASAQGGFTGAGRYEITNRNSGKVLDLDRNDPAKVLQSSSRGTDNQAWEIRSAGDNYYFLQNVVNGNALEAAGTRNSTPVRTARFVGGSNQKWRFESGEDGSAVIVSGLGKTLDISGASTSEGARVQTYERNGDSNQQFTFRLVSGNRVGSSGNTAGNPAPAVSSGSGGVRTALKPGWNMFSPEQDVEVGQQASEEVLQQVPMLNDRRVDDYLTNLGQRLAAQAPGFNFPYAFKTVNDRGINAFALPGGHTYINRGVIEAADNESQLAGVMAHEISHVALRHGTNQASKASIAQMPLAILGGLLGNNSAAAAVAQLGAGFTVNSILLKYSRDAESQADLMGTQILYDAGYDPRGMGQFFGKIEGGSGTAFFNSHPNPDHRVETANAEAARLVGSQRTQSRSSREFDQIKRYVESLPAPRPNQLSGQQPQSGAPAPGQGASERTLSFENSTLRLGYPDNWQAYGQADAVTIAPQGGMVDDGNGNQAMAYGVLVNIYEPHSEAYGQGLQGPGYGQGATMSAEAATDQLVDTLQQSNRNMRVVRTHQPISVNNERGLSTYLSNDSPSRNGGRETNWLVTLPRPEGLLFLVFTAPEREFQNYESTFREILYSLRMKQ